VNAVIKEYTLQVVQQYMSFISSNAEQAVRNLLRTVAARHSSTSTTVQLHAIDYMDDGTPIELTITIDAVEGSAIFDFEGTGPEMRGNLNAPIAVVSLSQSSRRKETDGITRSTLRPSIVFEHS
jgi:5-oxoprolinase (ATP-hydrolysing)